MNSKIMFLVAHPDDEAYGPAGTIAKLSRDNEVIVISLCNGARPGSEHVEEQRTEAFKNSCALLGADWRMYNSNDCTLEYRDTLTQIEMLIEHFRPDVVYTHNISDIHKDHSLIAECCLVACRPKPGSTVKELYYFEIPSSTDWSFGQIEPRFNPNIFVDITEFIDKKKQAMELYSTEIYNWPDARSVKAIEVLAETRGRQVGLKYAEAFHLVFAHD
jgi:LmbE family N-acetylglucosaminyl deacetylase